jgi:hypothetical protein
MNVTADNNHDHIITLTLGEASKLFAILTYYSDSNEDSMDKGVLNRVEFAKLLATAMVVA